MNAVLLIVLFVIALAAAALLIKPPPRRKPATFTGVRNGTLTRNEAREMEWREEFRSAWMQTPGERIILATKPLIWPEIDSSLIPLKENE